MIYNFGVCSIKRANNVETSYFFFTYVYNTALKFKICNPNEDIINYYSHTGTIPVNEIYMTNFGQNIYSESGVNSNDKKAFCIAIAIK